MRINTSESSEFFRLLLPVKKHLYNFIRKSMNFAADADDLYQETLIKAFKYFDSFDRSRSFRTWIFVTAHNLLKDHFRKMKLLPSPQELAEIESRMAADPADPGGVAEIYRIAGELKPAQRTVFFLYYYNEFRVAEIADITGYSQANIKFMLNRARRAIRKILEVQE